MSSNGIVSYLKRHFGILVQNRHVKHQSPEEVLKHGRTQVPATQTLNITKAHLICHHSTISVQLITCIKT